MAASVEVDTENPIFTSLGMFIIDENEYPQSWNREKESDIIGGGGSYAIMGARIIAGPHWGRKVCGIIDKGRDFPSSVEEELKGWGTGIKFRFDGGRLTSRGANIYTEDNIRNFEYRTEKKRIEIDDILKDEYLRRSECLHLLCSVERCRSLITDFEADTGKHSKIIYEPLPDVCKVENLAEMQSVLQLVDIFSPNLDEAASLAGLDGLPATQSELSDLALVFLPHLRDNKSAVVLRCGALGSFTKSLDQEFLLPAYHQDPAKVVDVTGGGNTYCGGFMAGYYLSKGNLGLASICGNLVSGCVIEKLGVAKKHTEENGIETWNGMNIKQRYDNYAKMNEGIFKDMKSSNFEWV